jgi:membrane-anchored protein YejM (alkaline phosphatase superfamily)
MFKLFISLFTIFTVYTLFSRASCEKQNKQILTKLKPVKLGRLRLFDLIENRLINFYDTQQKQRDDLLKKAIDRKKRGHAKRGS